MTVALPPADAAPKDVGVKWIEQVKWLVATLAIPLVLALIAHEFSERQATRDAEDRNISNQRSLRDSRLKAYTELLNKREEADMNVRKEIFSTLLGNYFDRTTGGKPGAPGSGDLTRRMTVLELLASNFDESLNLSPLFWQLERELSKAGEAEKEEIGGRLSRLADSVKRRQIDALTTSGGEHSRLILFNDPAVVGKPLFSAPVRLSNPALAGPSGNHGCRFEVTLLEFDVHAHRIYAMVQTEALREPAPANDSCVTPEHKGPKQWSFWIDEFDFPLISYTRLSTTERFSVVLSSYDRTQKTATVSLVYFPSSRSGARDRPFLDTVVDSLNAPTDVASAVAAAPAASR